MIDYIVVHWEDILKVISEIIATASVITRLIPTLKEDNFFLPVVKLVGKVSLNKYGPAKRPGQEVKNG